MEGTVSRVSEIRAEDVTAASFHEMESQGCAKG